MTAPTIVVAGATGHLGSRIVKALRARGAEVKALVRKGTDAKRLDPLRMAGALIVEADFNDEAALAEAFSGAHCVVSALLGLREVIVETQTHVLNAAVKAGVPRFIPSDYSLDFYKLPAGGNRNLDLHREFNERLEKAPIKKTAILNGAFMDLLTGQAPFILFGLKRVLVWGNADQKMEFTTMDNVAEYTAAASMDESAPPFLRIAGEQLTSRELAATVSEATGQTFKPFRAGGLAMLSMMIKVMRKLMPASNDPFPPWQGMQYMRDMFDGRAQMQQLDNARYPGITWTKVAEQVKKRGQAAFQGPARID